MSKHTPGPWVIDEWGNIVGQDGRAIADIYSAANETGERDEEEHANARLIAAAPDHALFVRALLVGTARWESFGGRSGVEGEVCVGGLRYCTKKDETGVPILNEAIRKALMLDLGEA